ncbi:MAG: MerR family DNA-binding transcriptional regulator [Thermoguttaceae bacterium]|nr:MerR family DNA-binding transcriptional regulator [Thermoguttaceae bacterium]
MDKLWDYLRISQAAEYLGAPPDTLRNWENVGKIAAHRHPEDGYRLYRLARSAHWIDDRGGGTCAGLSLRRQSSQILRLYDIEGRVRNVALYKARSPQSGSRR